ncbi:hypothetical protein Zmor_026017 [Zophobas morio]|uniref:Uncharacterized protein n=1 Tax=Zophobas morio TaxID=2755281 RepID=A0AA38M483_9CUCU|nr:hypothetical protein Zmor_026017 [Zophobas morio]
MLVTFQSIIYVNQDVPRHVVAEIRHGTPQPKRMGSVKGKRSKGSALLPDPRPDDSFVPSYYLRFYHDDGPFRTRGRPLLSASIVCAQRCIMTAELSVFVYTVPLPSRSSSSSNPRAREFRSTYSLSPFRDTRFSSSLCLQVVVYIYTYCGQSLLGNVLISVAAKIGVKGHFSLSSSYLVTILRIHV